MSIRSNIEKVKFYIKRYGFFSTLKKVFKRIFKIKENRKTNQEAYQIWIEKNTPNEDELEKQKTTKFIYAPKISVVVPMYNTDEKFFQDLIESLNNQTYANWELCLADGSPKKNENLEKYYEKNEKIN